MESDMLVSIKDHLKLRPAIPLSNQICLFLTIFYNLNIDARVFERDLGLMMFSPLVSSNWN